MTEFDKEAAIARLDAAKAAVKEAKDNVKLAKTYLASVDKADEASVAAGNESLSGWEAALVERSAELDAAKAASKAPKAPKAAKAPKEPKAPKIAADYVLSHTEKAESAKGLAAAVVRCVDGVADYEEVVARVVDTFGALDKPINSALWATNPTAYAAGHVAWWMKQGFIA